MDETQTVELIKEIQRLEIVYSASPVSSKKMHSPLSAALLAKEVIAGDSREISILVILNVQRRIVAYYRLAIGTSTTALVDVREIMKATLLHNGHSIIMVHNHPSGIPNYSEKDLESHEAINKACKLLNIGYLDNLILGEECFYSFSLDQDLSY